MNTNPSHRVAAVTPHGELVLQLRPGPPPSAALILEGLFLMDSESGTSERALATRGLAHLKMTHGARVLLGGLGLGITLRELLADPGVAHVDVVELFPELIEWNRKHLGFLNGNGLEDPRVRVTAGDLLAFIETTDAAYDLILLDIDNGPTMLSLPSNAELYGRARLEQLQDRLAPGGVIVFWATEPAPDFEEALAELPQGKWSREDVAWEPPCPGRVLTDTLYFLRAK